MEEEIKFSEWQEGVPPHDGVWQILDDDHDKNNPSIYYAKYQEGQWGPGYRHANAVKRANFSPYLPNNNPDNPRKWRGRLKETK